MLNLIRLHKYADLSGYTEKALYDKIHTGVWVEGRQFCKAPDGRILINIEEVEKWARKEPQA